MILKASIITLHATVEIYQGCDFNYLFILLEV